MSQDSEEDDSREGFVYVLSNPAMPGMVKIGFSKRHPMERRNELQTTGVPLPFKLEFAIWAEWAQIIESNVHQSLELYRVSQSREFFKIDVDHAIQEVINHFLLPSAMWTGDRWAVSLGHEILELCGSKEFGDFTKYQLAGGISGKIKDIVDTSKIKSIVARHVEESSKNWLEHAS